MTEAFHPTREEVGCMWSQLVDEGNYEEADRLLAEATQPVDETGVVLQTAYQALVQDVTARLDLRAGLAQILGTEE